jgi:hypothetical protein
VITGGARESARALAHGVALQPFGVGTQGAWAVFAPGVELVHFFFGFDGTQLHVAKASPNYPLSISGVEVGHGWHIVPVPCELHFGGACIAVTSDEKRLITQPFGRAGELGHEPLAPPGQIRTQFIARPGPVPSEAAPATPMHGFVPVQPTPHHVAGGQAWQSTVPIGAQVPQQQPALGSTVPLQASPVAFQPRDPAPLQAAPAPGYPKLDPAPAVVLGYGQQQPAPHAQSPHAHVQVPSHGPAPGAFENPHAAVPSAPTMNSAGPLPESLGPRTLGDGGALREHAARVAQATPSVAFASAQAYAAEVQRASGNTPPPADAPPGVERSAAALMQAPTIPQGAAEPFAAPPPVQPPVASEPKPKSSGLLASWREASLVKKLTLVLLPFGLVGVVLMPTDEPPPAVRKAPKVPSALSSASGSASSQPSAAASGAGSKVGAGAATVPASSGSVAQPALVASATPGPSAGSREVAPTSAVASASASAVPATNSAPATSAVPVAGGAASGAPVVALLPPASSSSAGPGYRRAPGAIERDAIYAAFEGRSEMAAKLYEQLASGGGDRIFALAARLAREDQVRKPVISH